jgi:hypothetical protein
MITTVRKTISATAIAATLALFASSTIASAATVYTENFNAPGFVGGLLSGTDTSDRFGATTYSYINDFGGWTFNASNTFVAQPIGGGDGAVLLNENGGSSFASTTITGLTAGSRYSLSFLLSGDNRPGQAFVLNGSIAGLSFSANGVDGASGSTAGTLLSYVFTATGPSAVLSFTQASVTEASPIIDNIAIATVPEPATWFLLVAGFGMVGVAARRRKTAVAA